MVVRWPIETDDFPIKTFIYEGFSIAMLNNQMVFISETMWNHCLKFKWPLFLVNIVNDNPCLVVNDIDY